MRGSLLTAAVVAAALGAGMTARQTAAAPALAAQRTALPAAPLERVANVCGRNGCAPVQTKRVVHQKPGSVAAKHI